MHELHVQCISKGKEHKKYEFGSKVSIITTKNTGVIIGAINIEKKAMLPKIVGDFVDLSIELCLST